MRRVGILGGMGPEATVLLMSRVLAAVDARDDADHVPLLVDQNSQVPSRIAHLIEGRGQDPGPVLIAMARRLEGAGAQALAMPCNTAHHYAAAIRGATGIPFLDMIDLSVARADALAAPDSPIGILASPAVMRVGLFDTVLKGIDRRAIYPRDQDALLAAIRAVKAHGPTAEAGAILRAASNDLAARGAKVQLIACTEFSMISGMLDGDLQAIDALDSLVSAIVTFARGDAQDDARRA